MQQILRDMLIWLVCFFGIASFVLFVVRWALHRARKQRAERLRLLETRFRESPDALGLPLVWMNAPSSAKTGGDQLVSAVRWILALGFLAAGIATSAMAKPGGNWNNAVFGAIIGSVSFLILSLWLYCRRVISMPEKTRRLAAAIRCWTIRLANGVDRRMALEQSARQLQRFDPELARCLEAAAVAAHAGGHDLIQRAFYPCGTSVSERLADILSGKVPDSLSALRSLADQLDVYYQNQILIRVKRVDGWLKYPIVLFLLPAVNLLVFGPALADLINNFGILKFPVVPAARPADREPENK